MAEAEGWRPATVGAILGAAATISYGTNYYAFGALAPMIASEFGIGATTLFGLFSLSIAVSSVAAPRAGRLVDRLGGPRAMAAGSALSALLLVLLAFSPGVSTFAVSLLLLQMSSTLVFYDAAFAVAVGLTPAAARRTITGITLIAGFSSTVFWPLTLGLTDAGWTWREVFLFYAFLNLAVCFPLHLMLGRGFSVRRGDSRPAGIRIESRLSGSAARRRAFVLANVAFGASGFAISGLHANLIPVLVGDGGAATAAMVGATIGPAQVAGRIGEFAFGPRISAATVAVAALLLQTLGLAALGLGLGLLPALIAAAAIYGAGQGLASIARGSLPLHFFGSEGYGALLGRINAAYLLAMAGGPVTLAAIHEWFGAEIFFLVLAASTLCGTVAALLLRRLDRTG